ncbi:MAG TPA: FHA domain-containing protein [Thermoanaerobaculia bacterium]|nr:FHA domain-containing protein [Thermoanaerobaculia bacterium]
MRAAFADCVLDTDTRELSRGGKRVHIEPKAFQLLELLIAARPTALSKSKLQDELWPRTYVSERSLARLVADLRTAIGDRAQKPRFLRTVHRFGYAFCGEATTVAAGLRQTDFHCRLVWGDREVALTEGENVLGRDPAVAVWIDMNSVSRRHARIVLSNGTATLEDLGSRNGTYLGDRRVAVPTHLSNGDQIKMGEARLVFRCFGKMGTTESEVAG